MWWRRRRGEAIEDAVWAQTLAALPILTPLDEEERRSLRALAERFIAAKSFEYVGEEEAPEALHIAVIATLACLPVLELGLDAYAPWRSIILYPAGFVARETEVDEDGVEHEWEEERSGEASPYGPVVFSLEDVEESGQGDGENVVIHEMAHKLDMLDGDANGCPPLHRDMDRAAWTRDFAAAFDALQRELDAGEEPIIDPYAATLPEEFFAVASELFFEAPDELNHACPAVYRHLRDFYRQDPLARLRRLAAGTAADSAG